VAVASLLSFDPAERPTMLQLLLSPVFASLRAGEAEPGAEAEGAEGPFAHRFEAFAAEDLQSLADV